MTKMLPRMTYSERNHPSRSPQNHNKNHKKTNALAVNTHNTEKYKYDRSPHSFSYIHSCGRTDNHCFPSSSNLDRNGTVYPFSTKFSQCNTSSTSSSAIYSSFCSSASSPTTPLPSFSSSITTLPSLNVLPKASSSESISSTFSILELKQGMVRHPVASEPLNPLISSTILPYSHKNFSHNFSSRKQPLFNNSIDKNHHPDASQHCEDTADKTKNDKTELNHTVLAGSSDCQDDLCGDRECLILPRTESNVAVCRVDSNASTQAYSAPPQELSLPEAAERKLSITYIIERIVGCGNFGSVFKARVADSGDVVAIKRVFQDQRYKSRELAILSELNHPNVIHLLHAFCNPEESIRNTRLTDYRYLNLVMNYMPETVHDLIRSREESPWSTSLVHVKYYIYQICRSLGYIHYLGICHRDVKPQNLLLDTTTYTIQLCDFGSAKRLTSAESNVSYICSRYYRAPELILGSSDYTASIDIWSMGCVFVELLLGRPAFAGESSVAQLLEIIKILGTPTSKQLTAMNGSYCEFQLPEIRPTSWCEALGSVHCTNAIDLVARLLQFDPTQRIRPFETLCHPFFNELRQEGFMLPDLETPPENLFNYTKEEINACTPEMLSILLPNWTRQKLPCVIKLNLPSVAQPSYPLSFLSSLPPNMYSFGTEQKSNQRSLSYPRSRMLSRV